MRLLVVLFSIAFWFVVSAAIQAWAASLGRTYLDLDADSWSANANELDELATSSRGAVFLIRHGEKVKQDRSGLSVRGEERAQCLKQVFGSGKRKVGYIMAQDFYANGRRARAYETVKGLSKYLSQPIDHSCDRDDAKCVARQVRAQTAAGHNVLVCWEHAALSEIAHELGVRRLDYPDDRYDVIYTIRDGRLRDVASEACPGLDKRWAKGKKKGHLGLHKDDKDGEHNGGDEEQISLSTSNPPLDALHVLVAALRQLLP